MTGGTLIIKKGNLYCMTKVAHDGFDLEEKLNQLKSWANASVQPTPKELALSYLKERSNNDGTIEYDFETNDFDHCVYERTFKKKISFEKVQEKMEQELMKLTDEDYETYGEDHLYNQLACSYDDFHLYIDMDSDKFILNGINV